MPKAKTSLNELLHEIRRIEENRKILTEDKIKKIYLSLLDDLNNFLANEYYEYADDGVLTVAILQEKAQYARFLEEIENHVENLTPETLALIRKTVEETYAACYSGMLAAVEQATSKAAKTTATAAVLNALSGLNVRPEVMKRAIENPISGLTLPDILERHRKEVIYDIKQTINIGLMNGDRYDTMARKIAERLDISYGKASNIVRTETHRVTESGFMDCAKDITKGLEGSDLIYVATWRTMKDERVRPQQRRHTKGGWKTTINKRSKANHVKMEGVTIKVGDKFKLEPHVYAEAPAMSGTARNDCRCRCFLEYDLITAAEWAALPNKQVNNKSDKAEKAAKARQLMTDNGIVDLGLEVTDDVSRFDKAIRAAKEANANGACVDTHPLDELKTFTNILAKDNMAGVAIKPDGDITAVFKNSNSNAKGAVNDLIITARANGGVKMDCYGQFLVNAYEKCGYVPVARIPFNADYVDDPYLLKIKPDVYAMMKNTDSIETVIQKNAAKAYKTSTQEMLDKLPTFDDYDEALKYRDKLLSNQTK